VLSSHAISHKTRHFRHLEPRYLTSYPRSASSSVAESPASPPPTTATRRLLPSGSVRGSWGFLNLFVDRKEESIRTRRSHATYKIL
jgi:hypothetical protein